MDEETLFAAALEMHDPAERAAFLDRACGGSNGLRERIEARLRRHEQPDASLHNLPRHGASWAREKRAKPLDAGEGNSPFGFLPPLEDAGRRIGPYHLLEKLGEGGQGTVWMAEQYEPVQRCVALKIIKVGTESARVLARFNAERNALARMDHPNIAKVIDAGRTLLGRPYFVMELVRGVRLTQFCDEEQLPPHKRLELFVLVCQAVQHAHQRGIIHRDLKPSNVLVAPYDGKPAPKVIDFGLAKAISQELSEHTIVTETGQILGTPEYMAPEQADSANPDIDTRADIYSLGVLLYELLTGSPPFPMAQLRRLDVAEMLRTLREVEPPKPSARLSGAADLADLAAKRKMEPRQLRKLVRNELDWIVMKCLEKDRGRRYQSAGELAADIQHYLAQEPVSAGPPSATYRLRKFVSRHKASVLAATLVLLALMGGIVGTGLGLLEAQRQRQSAEDSAARSRQAEAEARAVLTFFQDKVLAAARPKEQEGGLGVDANIRAAVNAAEPQITLAFLDQPRIEAEVRHTLGLTYLYLGQAKQAIAQYERAVELRRVFLGPDHPDTLRSMHNLAWAYQDDSRFKDAQKLAAETLELRQAALGSDHPDTLASMRRLAWAHHEDGHWQEALPLYRQTLELSKEKLGIDHPFTLGTMNDLGLLYKQTGRLKDALPLYEESLRRRRAVHGPDHPDTLESMNNLAMAYKADGRPKDAVPLLEETWKRKKNRLGPDHRYTLSTMNNLAEAYQESGRLKESLPLFEEALKRREATLGPNHLQTLISSSDLAAAYLAAGRFSDAVKLAEETLKRRRTALGADHPDTLTSMNVLATAYGAAKRLADAASLYRETVKLQIAQRGPDHPYVFITQMNLAVTYADMGRWDDALPLAESVVAKARVRLGPTNPTTLNFLDTLTILYGRRGQHDKAEPLLREIASARQKNAANEPRPYAVALVKEGRNLLRLQKFAAAEAILRDCLAVQSKTRPDGWETFYVRSLLGAGLLGQKKYAEAEPLLLQGYKGMKERAQTIPDRAKVRQTEALDRLVELYTAWNKKEIADKWRKEKTSGARETSRQ